MALRQVGAAQVRTAFRLARTSRQQALSTNGGAVHEAFSPSFSANNSSSGSTIISGTTGAARRTASVSCGSSKKMSAAAKRPLSSSASSGNPEVTSASVRDITSKFGDPSFWEGEYSSQYDSQEELQPFEWFLPYDGGLRQHLLPFLESRSSCSRLLHVGCGTSEVGPKLATEPGLSIHVTDADSSPSAVRIMKRRHASLDNYMCHQTDVLNLPFPEDSFDAVVDKGTLDALLCRNMEDAQAMATEMHRVLTKGGVFVQITTEDPESRLELLTRPLIEQGEPWSRSLFKEIGEGANATYFMYVLVK
eukprot:jgi/Undpi1/3801/HiC_scaffold_16.g07170.m1